MAPTPQLARGMAGFSASAGFSGHINTGHGDYSMSTGGATSLQLPQGALALGEAALPIAQGALAAGEAALGIPPHVLAVNRSAAPPIAKRYSCHICRWINEEIERCVSCGHRLCIDCEWLMPVARTDGTAQDFAIYEDTEEAYSRYVEMENRRRAENVYTPSEFEQENYTDSPDIPSLPPNVWARQAALAKAHYTTPQSPPPSLYTTPPLSPTITPSPPPTPMDNTSHISITSDYYPEPLRVVSSPVRPPAPRGRRVVRDNPFVVADQMAPGRVRRGARDEIRSRDGQVSPLEGRGGKNPFGSINKGGRPMWQTHRVAIPGLGAERSAAAALRAQGGGERVTEGAGEAAKLEPVVSETLTGSGSKVEGGIAQEGRGRAGSVPDAQNRTHTQQDEHEGPTPGLRVGGEASSHPRECQNTQGCPFLSGHGHALHYCGCRPPMQGYGGQACRCHAGHGAPGYRSFGHVQI
ncbi:hypothetical protein V490_04812, partial [Pseudogymnoascus sp. VKM F-3557]